MDPLTQVMLQRALAGQQQVQPPPQPSVPVVPPASAGKTNTPPEAQRFLTAQKMMAGYANNWTPNPMMIQATSK